MDRSCTGWGCRLVLACTLVACGGDDTAQDDDTDAHDDAHADADGGDGVDDGVDGGAGGGSDGGCIDADHDGFGAEACGGVDCDDADPLVHPEAPDNADFPWAIVAIDDEGTAGEQASVAVDAEGFVHVAYATYGVLRYATDRSGGWIAEVIDPSYGSAAALAIAADGALHVVYVGGGLRHASTVSGTWAIETIDPAPLNGAPGNATALAIDATGHLHVAYNIGGALRYATDASGAFVSELVADTYSSFGTSVFPSGLGLAVSAQGEVHIAYGSAEQLVTHAVRGAQGWAFESIQGGEGTYVGGAGAAAFDEDGVFHLAFHGRPSSDSFQVFHATKAVDADWNITAIAEYGDAQPALAVQPGGAAHVVFAGGGYATDLDGTWALEDASLGGPGASVAVDGDRSIHVAWSVSGQLGYARRVQPDDLDQNCDGIDGVDDDHDGFASVESGGKDCDDLSPLAFPGAEDPPGDGVDQNCDGLGGTED
jgi:hypothetical protein